jgi:hypothetical protein
MRSYGLVCRPYYNSPNIGFYIVMLFSSVIRDKTLWFTKVELVILLLFSVSGVLTDIGIGAS